MNIDPRGLTVIEWTEFTSLPLARLTVVPRLLDPTQWKEWGLIVMQAPLVSRFDPPDPSRFDSWVDWAIRFNQAVPL